MNPQIRRLALDLGPLLIFFAAFKYLGIFGATAAFMAAVLAALAIGWLLEKRLSPMPLFTAVLVVIFGGLTLYLKNDIFIKMKPTVLYGFFGAVLLGGLFFNRLFIKYVFAQAFELDETGWKKLTVRWGIFFLLLAVVNETVWRHTSTATWVAFKVWGIIPLIFLFALAQTRLVIKHQSPDAANGGKTRNNDAHGTQPRALRTIFLERLQNLAAMDVASAHTAYHALCRILLLARRVSRRRTVPYAAPSPWITMRALCNMITQNFVHGHRRQKPF